MNAQDPNEASLETTTKASDTLPNADSSKDLLKKVDLTPEEQEEIALVKSQFVKRLTEEADTFDPNPNSDEFSPELPKEEVPQKNPIQEQAEKALYHISQICNSFEEHDKLLDIDLAQVKKEDAAIRGSSLNKFITHLRTPTATTLARENQRKLDRITGKQVKHGSLKQARSYTQSHNVSGKAARVAFAAAMRGVYRVRLYNTGIFVDLVPPTAAELSAVFESVDMRYDQIGKVLGEITSRCTNLMFKEAIVELLETCTATSNLVNWDKGHNLANTISMNDYEDLVWAFCAITSDRKLDVEIECLKCNHIFSKTYDLGKFQLITNITQEAYEWISTDRAEVTRNDLIEYKKLLGYDGRCLEYKDASFVLRVPTLVEVIEQNKEVLGKLESRLTGEATLSNRKAINELTLMINHNFPVWIQSASVKKFNSDERIRTTDQDQFAAILDTYGLEMEGPHEKFLDGISDYMIDSKATIIGYTPTGCVNCGDIQPTNSGYIAWDPEQVFFGITYLTLARSGMLMMDDRRS